MRMISMFLALCGLSCGLSVAQAPQIASPTRQWVQNEPQSSISVYRVTVIERTTKAINYKHRSGATKIDFRGTDLLPMAHGEAKVESKQGYIEVEVPLLADQTLIDELSIGGAYRYSDYSTVGSTDAYTGRLSRAPTVALRFRVQYAKAVRAPNINELFAPGGENFAPVSDPCDDVTATTPGDIATNCRSIPAIAARIAAEGVFAPSRTCHGS